MICIKNKSTSEIVRVSNRIAYDRVNTGLWQYCPKHEYKAYRKEQEQIKQDTTNK